MAPHLEQYLIDLIIATRQPQGYGTQLKEWISYGASPRATLALMRTAKARAWLDGRDFVMPDDIIQNLDGFTAGEPQFDDITLIGVHRK